MGRASDEGKGGSGPGGSKGGGGSGGGKGGGGSGGGHSSHQWEHVFTNKRGHVGKVNETNQERYKSFFLFVRDHGEEKPYPKVPELKKSVGEIYKTKQYNRGEVWVLFTKNGYIKSAGVDRP